MRKQSVAGLLFSSKAGKGGYNGGSFEMYALDTISFPGFCGSYEKIQGWFQSHSIFTNLWPEIRDLQLPKSERLLHHQLYLLVGCKCAYNDNCTQARLLRFDSLFFADVYFATCLVTVCIAPIVFVAQVVPLPSSIVHPSSRSIMSSYSKWSRILSPDTVEQLLNRRYNQQ